MREWRPIGNGAWGAAKISACENYRYWLGRMWDGNKQFIGYIGLNPSTADAMKDDPTIRRCIGFARDLGYGGIYMLNVFALRSTNPKALSAHPDPVGFENDETLDYMATKCQRIIACWGSYPLARSRAGLICRGRVLECFGVNADGQPKHPLYLPKTAQLHVYRSSVGATP